MIIDVKARRMPRRLKMRRQYGWWYRIEIIMYAYVEEPPLHGVQVLEHDIWTRRWWSRD
jgi:hypothetical protein